jgi:Protein of unknown function (DUF2934)
MNTRGDPKAVRQLAHLLWEQHGRQEGRALDDWLAAERQLAEKAAARSPPSKAPNPPADDVRTVRQEIPKLASSDAPGG